MQIFSPRNSGINSWLILFSCELIDVILNNFQEAANRLHLNAIFPTTFNARLSSFVSASY